MGILVCRVGYSEYTDLVTAQIEVGILVYRFGYFEYTDLVDAYGCRLLSSIAYRLLSS